MLGRAHMDYIGVSMQQLYCLNARPINHRGLHLSMEIDCLTSQSERRLYLPCV